MGNYPPAGYPREPEQPKAIEGESIAKAYERLQVLRYHFVSRAHDNAALTIPAVMRPSQYTSTTALDTPWQSTGAKGVNNLASKLSLALFPPGLSFFRYDVNPFVLAQVAAEKGMDVKGLKSEIDQNVSVVERQISRQIEASGMRATLYECFQHLLVTGNGVLYIKQDLGIRFYNLKEYVCLRDTSGNLIRLIMVDRIAKEMLPDEYKNIDSKEDEQPLVYTDVIRIDQDTFEVRQEIFGQRLATNTDGLTDAKIKEDKLPFIVLRFQQLSGESYGRAFVEDMLGDLAAHEGLRQALVEAAAAAAKLIFLVNPNGLTRPQDLSDAENGAYVSGSADDVSTLAMEKLHDFAFAAKENQEIKKDLEEQFLMSSAFRRDAERVTAEEIRMVQQQLESSLGGVYSLLSEQLQLPLVNRMASVMERNEEIPPIPTGIMKPQITTGIEGLGRGADFQNTVVAVQTLAGLVGPEALAVLLDNRELAMRLLTGAGVDAHSLLHTEQEVQEINEENSKRAAMEAVAPQVATGVSNIVRDQTQPQKA